MEKPKLEVSEYHVDYHDMMEYINEKYGYNNRDYSDTFNPLNIDKDLPYQDFWHWLLGRKEDEISNPCTVYLPIDQWLTLSTVPIDRAEKLRIENPKLYERMKQIDYLPEPEADLPDWVQRILLDIKTEFGQYFVEGNLNVYISW